MHNEMHNGIKIKQVRWCTVCPLAPRPPHFSHQYALACLDPILPPCLSCLSSLPPSLFPILPILPLLPILLYLPTYPVPSPACRLSIQQIPAAPHSSTPYSPLPSLNELTSHGSTTADCFKPPPPPILHPPSNCHLPVPDTLTLTPSLHSRASHLTLEHPL